MVDILSDVLENVRLSGSVLFLSEYRAPWSVLSPSSSVFAPMLVPQARRLAVFHILIEGGCVVGRPEETPVSLAAGDAVILAHGDAHILADQPGRDSKPLLELLPMPPWSEPPYLDYGGDGKRTRILCGYLHCADARLSPFLDTLPPVMRIDGGSDVASSLFAVQNLLIEEARDRRPGYFCVLERLTETFFIAALRQYMTRTPDAARALAALKDPVVGRALGLLHAEPMRAWTVPALAREAAVSRSTLASRFVSLIGCPPMQYLTRWRLQLAARRLREGEGGIAEIAAAVGYESEAAFNRAFKRHLGAPPATWLGRRA
jgi:AraC-like DNA-binding protein